MTDNVLRAQHWGGTSFADAKGGETEFFSREYGLTRWEAWQLDGHCGANHTAPCQPSFGLCGTDGARHTDGQGRHWVRDGCRDWMHISPDPDGGYDPHRYPVSTALIAGANLLDNGDFGHTASPDDCGRGVPTSPSCTPTLGANWKRTNNTNWSIIKASNVSDFFLATNCISGVCSSIGEEMIYQDVKVPALSVAGSPLSFGGHFWADNENRLKWQAQLSLFQLSTVGTVIHETEARVEMVNSTGGRRRLHASASGQVQEGAALLRWRFALPKQGDATYHMDNAFLSTTHFASQVKTDDRGAKTNTLTTARPSAAQSQLMDMGLAQFMHFSVDTFSNGIEHNCVGTKSDCIPAAAFNPTDLDTDQWVKSAVAMGAGEICLTAHHEGGFCLWDTKYSNYSVMHSPFGKDVVKLFVASCRKFGVRPCFYMGPNANGYLANNQSCTYTSNRSWISQAECLGSIKRRKSCFERFL